MTLSILLIFAFLAGFVDATVGGGGLILLPALFFAFPNVAPAWLLGTNKFASISGTSLAVIAYLKRVPVPWTAALFGSVSALTFSWLGARSVSLLHPEDLKPIMLCLLIAMGIYTFLRKDFGGVPGKRKSQRQEALIALIAVAVIGFYDGFFGPGTGTLLVFVGVRLLSYDFLTASVFAKVINWMTNFAAITYFIMSGTVMYSIAIPLAISNMLGNYTGAHFAILKGNLFVRKFFLCVLLLMILRFAWEVFAK